MGRGLLAVNEAKAPSVKLSEQSDQRHFARVIDLCEHRLGKERPAHRDAIQSSNEMTIVPCLDRVGIAEIVESCVSVQHLSRDPGASLRILRTWSCTLFHDLSKASIERNGEHIRAEASFKTARHVKLLREQDGSGIRRPPENRLIVVVPGENAMPIGFEKALRSEISSHGKEALRRGSINGREPDVVLIHSKHLHVRYAKRGKKTMPVERRMRCSQSGFAVDHLKLEEGELSIESAFHFRCLSSQEDGEILWP